MIAAGNLLDVVPAHFDHEEFAELLTGPHVMIERIVSVGHASPPGFWYDQDWAEWLVVLAGAAELRFESEPQPRRLGPGDYLNIPPHARHRVEWTDAEQPTVWLAVHYR